MERQYLFRSRDINDENDIFERIEDEKNFAMEYLYNEKLIFCRKLIFLLWNDHRVRIFHCNFKQAGFNGIFEHRIENILIFLSLFHCNCFRYH